MSTRPATPLQRLLAAFLSAACLAFVPAVATAKIVSPTDAAPAAWSLPAADLPDNTAAETENFLVEDADGNLYLAVYVGKNPYNGADVYALSPMGLEIGTYEESGLVPRGYSPYYYGTTFGDNLFAQTANLGSLINNSFWVGLQNINAAAEVTGLNTLINAMGPAGLPASGPQMLVRGTAKAEQMLTTLSSKALVTGGKIERWASSSWAATRNFVNSKLKLPGVTANPQAGFAFNPFAEANAFSHMHAVWAKRINTVVEGLEASGRPKIMVLGEGGQGQIASFVNRDPRRVTEFLELRPKSLDYSEAFRAGNGTKTMLEETLDFNLFLIRKLKERGFTFEVMGDIVSSEQATSSWLKAELKVLESLGVKWKTIPKTTIEEVKSLPPWGRPRN